MRRPPKRPYFATTQAYVAARRRLQDPLPGFQLSDTVKIGMARLAGANPSFTGTSNSTSGSGKTFTYNSAKGGMQ